MLLKNETVVLSLVNQRKLAPSNINETTVINNHSRIKVYPFTFVEIWQYPNNLIDKFLSD